LTRSPGGLDADSLFRLHRQEKCPRLDRIGAPLLEETEYHEQHERKPDDDLSLAFAVVAARGTQRHSGGEAMANALTLTVWFVVSCASAELLGYGLHRLLHSGLAGFLSRNHMKHHMVLYGPLQEQRSKQYRDATDDSISLGNIGIEWLIPAAVLIVCVLGLFHLFHVRLLYRLIYFATTLG